LPSVPPFERDARATTFAALAIGDSFVVQGDDLPLRKVNDRLASSIFAGRLDDVPSTAKVYRLRRKGEK
jgi:hypothetical protein